MSNRRSFLLFVRVKIRRFLLPFVVPLRVFWECIDAAEDLLLFTGNRIAGRDIGKAVGACADALRVVSSVGSYDLVDVEAKNKVSVKIGLR